MKEIYEKRSSIAKPDKYTQPFRVVIRRTKPNEYATHLENLELGPVGFRSKKNREFYWGHYFTSLADAKEDFNARCKRYGLS